MLITLGYPIPANRLPALGYPIQIAAATFPGISQTYTSNRIIGISHTRKSTQSETLRIGYLVCCLIVFLKLKFDLPQIISTKLIVTKECFK